MIRFVAESLILLQQRQMTWFSAQTGSRLCTGAGAFSGSTGSGEGSGEDLGSLSAAPGQVQQCCGEGSGQGRGRRSDKKFRRKV